jgi:hypothetical protein
VFSHGVAEAASDAKLLEFLLHKGAELGRNLGLGRFPGVAPMRRDPGLKSIDPLRGRRSGLMAMRRAQQARLVAAGEPGAEALLAGRFIYAFG